MIAISRVRCVPLLIAVAGAMCEYCLLNASQLTVRLPSTRHVEQESPVDEKLIRHTAHVGITGKIFGVIVPGTPLIAKPITDDLSPFVLRIVDKYPHGTAWRYDFEFMGLEPGTFGISDFVEREDGTPLGEFPAVEIEIQTSIPPGQITPHSLGPMSLSRLGGYRVWMVVIAAGWVVGLALLLFAGYRKKQLARIAARPTSFAEYLRPRLQAALDGELSADRFAELERMITAFWRKRLALENLDVAQSIARIKADDNAGPLLRELERAMHDPRHTGQAKLAELLKPLESIPWEEVEAAV